MSQMQASGYSPTIRKRALSRKLVALRTRAGLSTTEVCRRLNWSPTRLNYIEKAKWVVPNTDHVIDLCELYGVEGSTRDALVQLARDARQRGWWAKYNDVFTNEFPGFEAGASTISTFQASFIPGLIQVPAYIELATRTAGITDRDEIRRHVDARTKRQQVLVRDDTPPCRLHAVIDESAINRINDSGIRSAQIAHILTMMELPTVDIQILPVAAGLYPGATEDFTYLEFQDPADRNIVFLETTIDHRMLEEPDELQRYRAKFDILCNLALTVDTTRTHFKQQIE